MISPKQAQKLPRVILLILKVKENPLWFSVLPSSLRRCHPMALLDLSLRALYRDTTSGTEEGIFSPTNPRRCPAPWKHRKAYQPCPGLVLRVAALRISVAFLRVIIPFFEGDIYLQASFSCSLPRRLAAFLHFLWSLSPLIQTGSICAHKISLLSDRLATSLVSSSQYAFSLFCNMDRLRIVQTFKFCLPSAVCSQVRRGEPYSSFLQGC